MNTADTAPETPAQLQHPPGHWDRLSEMTPADWDAAMQMLGASMAASWWPDNARYVF